MITASICAIVMPMFVVYVYGLTCLGSMTTKSLYLIGDIYYLLAIFQGAGRMQHKRTYHSLQIVVGNV